MKRAIDFGMAAYSSTMEQWRRGDPMLMGAAIAYNSLFALVPLAIAFLSIVALFDRSNSALFKLVDLITQTFPPEISTFLVDLLQQSNQFVSDDSALLLTVSILIALWSGSRAVYAAQKALRLVDGGEDERGYIRGRLTGVVVTVGAGASVMVGYGLLLLGEDAWNAIASFLGLGRTGYAQAVVSVLALLWMFGLLWVLYRFGPPVPVEHAGVLAGIVTTVLVLGTWLAFNLLPGGTNESLAVFGSLGLLLIWLYFVGIAVVAAPIVVLGIWAAWSDLTDRYPVEDGGKSGETQGSEDGTATPS
ncbi:MAG: YihY/virulence factor BrkB family protein [Actinomycetia bacterium]|nr:YihY/virulence factor BrkB family protein [Actinomycetes bacterium]